MTIDIGNAPTIRVSLIIINEAKQILLVKHKKATKEYWVLPGGHLEYGETIQECALRELQEETNLLGEFQRIVFISESIATNQARHIINIFALVRILYGELKLGEEDVLVELAYKDLNDINKLEIYPDIKEHILKAEQNGWTSRLVEVLQTPWT